MFNGVVCGDALDADAFGSFDLVCGSAFADLVRPEILADGLRRIGTARTAYLPITFAARPYSSRRRRGIVAGLTPIGRGPEAIY